MFFKTYLILRECWVLQSTAEYAQEVIEKAGMGKPSEELLSTVTQTLLEHFRTIGETPAPLFAKSHRWYAGSFSFVQKTVN